ncbi:NAD(P)-binding domain-containing protein [Flavihumibacter rivuli]|uniref:flavin-containing monooxygenase n=1 Tax=Flavihumibacter rivuli TaxID=2838156 RepID=UPI001BDE6752|nr:NAD(P)-binding domain-containing protein [Flavihumibacter rivuli]ULQ56071.1 NAD(P)-binding domain-containing protein [Flavihumibacter rivuli]
MPKHVCVIGAGPSGITAAKNLLDEGLQVTVYDYGREVGGNWVFTEEESHSSVFETTHIISSKSLSEYADFPMPEDYPDYPSHVQLKRYFQDYAQTFNLIPHIQFQTLVRNCSLNQEGKWEVTIEKDGEVSVHQFDALAVCNGHHWLPRMPELNGHFEGELLHSHHVKRFSRFAGKRVLVIGGGNSACDVAVESSRVAASVDMSWRRGYWIAPKFIMGKPADVFSHRVDWLPRWLWQRLTAISLFIRNGKNSMYGLQEPDGPIGSHHPTINEDLFFTIRHGKIKPRPGIEKVEGRKVLFTDGSTGEYDTIVACTGYVISHPFFDQQFIDYSEGQVPLWLRMIHPVIPNLYFIGLFQPLGCIWPGSELQSKIMAREIAGKWKRPSNVAELVERELRHPDFHQINTPRHTITVNYHLFRKRLLKHLPKDYIRRHPLATESHP